MFFGEEEGCIEKLPTQRMVGRGGGELSNKFKLYTIYIDLNLKINIYNIYNFFNLT